MKTKKLIRSAAASLLACGALGIAATSASAGSGTNNGAWTGSAAGLSIGFPPLSEVQDPGLNVGTGCPSWVLSDGLGFTFLSGNATMYQLNDPHGGGGNAEGQAVLLDNGETSQWTGHAHIWFTSKENPNYSPGGNQQTWQGTTLSFNGASPDGSSTININGSFGGGTSATGHPDGWFHLKVSCTGFTA